MTPILRPYQEKFIDDIRAAMRTSKRVCGVAATGAGKTVSFSYIANGAFRKNNRVYIIAHRIEILRQISASLAQYNLPHGWICPGRTPTDDYLQIGMIQTITRRLERLPHPDIVILDETHHAVSNSYQSIFDLWDKAYFLGVTATPLRLDGKGLGAVFSSMVLGPQTRELIDQGFLAPFDYYAPQLSDFSGVKTRAGDYASEQIAEIMDKPVITGSAIAHYKKFLPGRTAIAFCVTVAHAEHTAAQFREAGIPAASIDGSMLPWQRDRICSDLACGAIKVMTSCELVSEGFDSPAVNGAILLRPTKSLAMYLQMIGRVLRLKPDGSRAVILDHVGNINTHGMPDTPRKWSLDTKKRKTEKFDTVKCDQCFKVFATGPGWKKDAKCEDDMPPGCALLAEMREISDGTRELEQVDGELAAITDSPEWAGGISITRAHGREWFALLHRADTAEKLKTVQKMRGYHWGWVKHQMAAKQKAA